ncbi:MAG TPA: PPOX class F420-dependent oxidoreductase [Chloroflexota bacterium]|nr:PPOX class F420-dependent oxidoreductase [Chloroflexota bacterium]
MVTVSSTQLDALKQLLQETSRGVLMTRRRDGGIQSSPMALLGDDEGNLLFSTRAATAKVKNLQRDPYAAVCIITEKFLGPWMHVEGQADITFLPEAMPLLADFYRRRGFADDTDSEAFKQRMQDEGRCLIRVRITRTVQPPSRPPARPQPGA